jgi:hypothetical protein
MRARQTSYVVELPQRFGVTSFYGNHYHIRKIGHMSKFGVYMLARLFLVLPTSRPPPPKQIFCLGAELRNRQSWAFATFYPIR